MGQMKYRMIDRILQAELDWVASYVDKISKTYWNPYDDLSIDDDLDCWQGRGWTQNL